MRTLQTACVFVVIATTLAQANPPATQPASYDKLFARSAYVLSGKLADKIEDQADGWHTVTLDVTGGIFSEDGNPPSSLIFRFSDADGYKAGQEGVWFIQKTEKGLEAHGEHFRPAAEKDAVIKAVEPLLENQITEHIQALTEAYKKDPDGDKEETWKLMRQLVMFGANEIYFPTFRERTTDHPSRGHLADMYKALGAELSVVPYPKTPEEKAAAIAALQKGATDGDRRTLPPPADPNFDESFDFALREYMYHRFSILRSTLAADPAQFKGLQEELKAKSPDGPPVSRMAAFKLLLQQANKGSK